MDQPAVWSGAFKSVFGETIHEEILSFMSSFHAKTPWKKREHVLMSLKSGTHVVF